MAELNKALADPMGYLAKLDGPVTEQVEDALDFIGTKVEAAIKERYESDPEKTRGMEIPIDTTELSTAIKEKGHEGLSVRARQIVVKRLSKETKMKVEDKGAGQPIVLKLPKRRGGGRKKKTEEAPNPEATNETQKTEESKSKK